MLFTQLEQLTSEDFVGCCLPVQLPERHAEHTSNSGNLKAHASSRWRNPTDVVNPLTLDETVKSFSGDRGILGLVTKHLLLVLWKAQRCSDIHEREYDLCNNLLWRALKSGHLNKRQRHLALQAAQMGSDMFYRTVLTYDYVYKEKVKRYLEQLNHIFVCWRGNHVCKSKENLPAQFPNSLMASHLFEY